MVKLKELESDHSLLRKKHNLKKAKAVETTASLQANSKQKESDLLSKKEELQSIQMQLLQHQE